MTSPLAPETDDLEVQAFGEAVYRAYGHDFRDYAPTSFRRRVLAAVQAERLRTVAELLDKCVDEPSCMERFLSGVSVTVTSMFRDPGFYRTFRAKVAPVLRTYPLIRIWHAGCSSGEEVYSMAILLHEEGLSERSVIYATDLNEVVLDRAKGGILPLPKMEGYAEAYREAGGKAALADYYTAKYGSARMHLWLKKNIVFARHNLATDGSLNEFQVVMCRNVMIYFNKSLQSRVHGLIFGSLVRLGYLGLGSKESLKFSSHESRYKRIDPSEGLYRRVD